MLRTPWIHAPRRRQCREGHAHRDLSVRERSELLLQIAAKDGFFNEARDHAEGDPCGKFVAVEGASASRVRTVCFSAAVGSMGCFAVGSVPVLNRVFDAGPQNPQRPQAHE